MPKKRAVLLLILSAILWSLGGVLIKSVHLPALAIASGRSGISACILFLYVRKPRITWSRAQIGGAIAYAGTVGLFVLANTLTTAANAILIQYTAPLFVAIFGARYLGEKTFSSDWKAIFLALAGMTLFFFDRLQPTDTVGNLCALGSGVCFAWLILFLRKQKETSPVESILLGNILMFFIGIPIFRNISPDLGSLAALVTLGVVQLGIPYILYSIAIRQVRALEAAIIPIIEPILNPLWVWFFLGEVPGKFSIVGGAVVLGAVVMRAMSIDRSIPERTASGGAGRSRT